MWCTNGLLHLWQRYNKPFLAFTHHSLEKRSTWPKSKLNKSYLYIIYYIIHQSNWLLVYIISLPAPLHITKTFPIHNPFSFLVKSLTPLSMTSLFVTFYKVNFWDRNRDRERKRERWRETGQVVIFKHVKSNKGSFWWISQEHAWLELKGTFAYSGLCHTWVSPKGMAFGIGAAPKRFRFRHWKASTWTLIAQKKDFWYTTQEPNRGPNYFNKASLMSQDSRGWCFSFRID